MPVFRRPRLPDDVQARLALDKGERVLAVGRAVGGSYVVATDRALHWPEAQAEDPAQELVQESIKESIKDGAEGEVEEASGYSRLGWEHVERAAWDEDTATLRFARTGGPRDGHAISLEEPAFVPETVRERVMSTIVVDQRVRLLGDVGARIVGRRRPGTDTVEWWVTYDPGLDHQNPDVHAAAERALADVRARTGV